MSYQKGRFNLVDTKGNKQRAALTLGISLRQVNRLIKGYKEFGKAFFSHGNKGRKPVTVIPDETRKLVIDLYNMKYFDSNFSHYTELLEQYEDICLSVSTVSSILESQFILSPLATKARRKRVKDMLTANMFKTLQSRLPVELRLAGITKLNAANKFPDSYLQKFNAKFALPIDNTKSVFEIHPSTESRYIIARHKSYANPSI